MTFTSRFLRPLAAVAVLLVLAACAKEDLSRPPEPFGDFRLAHNIVVARNAKMAPPSRSATAEEWETVMKEEIQKRIGRYEGEKLYHLGINVDAYALAIPGVPLVLKPRSILVVSANVWDDSAGVKINAEPRQITVFESTTAKTFIGSGLTQNKHEQMRNLSASAARAINRWLVENKAWFTPEAVAARAALPRTPAAPGPGQPGN